MKRILVVLLSLLYLGAGSGFSLRQHFCMGQHVGSAIDHPLDISDTHRCSLCGMEKSSSDDGCCQDKVVVLKASPDQLPASGVSLPVFSIAGILPAPVFIPERAPLYASIDRPAFQLPDPPGPADDLPRYLRLRCFRI